MRFERIVFGGLCIGLAITVLSGCTSDRIPAEWEAAYQSLDLAMVNARDQQVVDCLSENGFPGFTTVWNGGIESPPITTEQREIVRKTIKACQEQVSGDRLAEPNDQQLTARYHLEVAAAQCLDDHGYSAPAPPPSLQEYLDQFGTERQWSAYSSIADQVRSDGDLRRIATDCPDPNWFIGVSMSEPGG